MLIKDIIIMINNSPQEYYFICACIAFLHHVAYAGILCCILSICAPLAGFSNPLPLFVQIWGYAETAFYFLVYIPLRSLYQNAADHPPLPSRMERMELFHRCHDTITNPERYLTKWFKNAPISEIKRDNLKEFFAWGFLNSDTWSAEEDEELEQYVSEMEKKLDRKIPEGRGTATPFRLTLDNFEPLHRSLLWYFCVSVVDSITYVRLLSNNYHFHRLPLSHFWALFPFRPVALFTRHVSPSNSLTYWHRPHTSKTKMPIVFIHGIGIGLYPYTKFLNELNHSTETAHHDGDVGLLLIELMPISFRITSRPLRPDELCREIHNIVQKHGWTKFVLASHSYGSVVSTQMLHDEKLSPMIGPMLLIDPVCFILHFPDVALNFTFSSKKPLDANELQLWYFASKDISVAWTLARHFFWAECILWKEDLKGRQVTVSMGGRDLIVDTQTVGDYLTNNPTTTMNGTKALDWKKKGWTGDDFNIVWFENLDHAQVFDVKRTRKVLVDILRAYCSMDAKMSSSVKPANGHT